MVTDKLIISIYKILKKHKEYKENLTKYNLDISSNFEKNIVNKDSSGNAKNYEIVVLVDNFFEEMLKDNQKEYNQN